MKLTRLDSDAVHRTEKYVRFLESGTLTTDDLVDKVLECLYHCETDLGIEQCMAVVPQGLWPRIQGKFLAAFEDKHPGKMFAYHVDRSPIELERLDDRFRHMMEVVMHYMAKPSGRVEYEIEDPNGLRMKWAALQRSEIVDGEPCRDASCTDFRIRNGVYCRTHHFEMLFGQRPPLPDGN